MAGDPSGDLHASHLIRALKEARPGICVLAVGGPLMRREADEFVEDLAGRGVTGFLEPLLKLRFLTRLGLRLRRLLRERRPDGVVCVDYWGFNRRVLELASAAGVPALYYVSPQVWASRPGRVRLIARLVRLMLVIFPFEEAIYRTGGVPCRFVGHPLLDLLPEPETPAAVDGQLRVGLLPGSRPSEVGRHLPLMLSALERLRLPFPKIEACVFAAHTLPDSAYAAAAAAGVAVVREADYARRRRLHLALCSSGTATLENALLGIPMVVVYKLSWPTYLIARALIRVPYIAMANLLAGKMLAPELIQSQATPTAVAGAAADLLGHPRRYQALREELLSLRGALGGPGAASRAAREILAELARPAATRGRTRS